jgi:hypothetical protein
MYVPFGPSLNAPLCARDSIDRMACFVASLSVNSAFRVFIEPPFKRFYFTLVAQALRNEHREAIRSVAVGDVESGESKMAAEGQNRPLNEGLGSTRAKACWTD